MVIIFFWCFAVACLFFSTKILVVSKQFYLLELLKGGSSYSKKMEEAFKSISWIVGGILFFGGLLSLMFFGLSLKTLVATLVGQLIFEFLLWIIINHVIFPHMFGPVYLIDLEEGYDKKSCGL